MNKSKNQSGLFAQSPIKVKRDRYGGPSGEEQHQMLVQHEADQLENAYKSLK